jgi:hypothetical protein
MRKYRIWEEHKLQESNPLGSILSFHISPGPFFLITANSNVPEKERLQKFFNTSESAISRYPGFSPRQFPGFSHSR